MQPAEEQKVTEGKPFVDMTSWLELLFKRKISLVEDDVLIVESMMPHSVETDNIVS